MDTQVKDVFHLFDAFIHYTIPLSDTFRPMFVTTDEVLSDAFASTDDFGL